MTRMINGIDEMKTLVGEHLGWSPYTEITQEQVQQFASESHSCPSTTSPAVLKSPKSSFSNAKAPSSRRASRK